MNHRIAIAAFFALALVGCATTDTGHNRGSYAGVYDGGYYVAAQDGYGDYYYDRPQVVYAYDPWYSDPFGFYGFGYSPWGFGYGPWYYGSPWYWHHPYGWHRPWAGVEHPLAEPASNPRLHENRAPRHGFQHPRP